MTRPITQRANALRGEAAIIVQGTPHLLRPSFTALVAAEEELGPLFALVERAGAGQLRLAELAALFWHCLAEPNALSRAQLGEAVAALGLARASQPLRVLLSQILQGDAAAPGG
jgi:Phage tail tube protein, GTA-gp10